MTVLIEWTKSLERKNLKKSILLVDLDFLKFDILKFIMSVRSFAPSNLAEVEKSNEIQEESENTEKLEIESLMKIEPDIEPKPSQPSQEYFETLVYDQVCYGHSFEFVPYKHFIFLITQSAKHTIIYSL